MKGNMFVIGGIIVIFLALGLAMFRIPGSIIEKNVQCETTLCGDWTSCVGSYQQQECQQNCVETARMAQSNSQSMSQAVQEVTCTGAWAGRCTAEWQLDGGVYQDADPISGYNVYFQNLKKTYTNSIINQRSCNVAGGGGDGTGGGTCVSNCDPTERIFIVSDIIDMVYGFFGWLSRILTF